MKTLEKIDLRRKLKPGAFPRHAGEAQGRAPQSIMLAIRDMAIGGFAGGLAGAALGRWSLLGGALTTGLAYYLGKPALAGLGIGMAAVAISQKREAQTLEGTSSELAQDRMKAFLLGFKEKLFLDKLKAQKEKPPVEVTETGQLLGELSPLDELESQMLQYALEQQREEIPSNQYPAMGNIESENSLLPSPPVPDPSSFDHSFPEEDESSIEEEIDFALL